ncbi:MAG: lysophospholipid acyltransferase family protein [Spartobacteria bacterium]
MANRVLPLHASPPALDSMPTSRFDERTGLFAQQRAFLLFYWRCLGFTAWLLMRKKDTDREVDVAVVRSRLSKGSAQFFSDLAARNLVRCEFAGFEDVASWKGSIICANHPAILDAICFFWKIPGIGCVVGTNPWSNPLLSLPARLADFVPRDPALRMLKECRQRLQRGENILLFPEGTRTTRGALNPFHDGPALLSVKARAPIRTVFIETNSLFLGKGYSFFKTTTGPIKFRFSVGEIFQPGAAESARDLSRRLEGYYSQNLGRNGENIFRLPKTSPP